MSKNTIGLSLTAILILASATAYSQTTIDTLFRDSYRVYESMRLNHSGLYLDEKLLGNNNDTDKSSIAATGVGLVSLCIAHARGWDADAANKVIKTLETLNGLTPFIRPSRADSGFFSHFMHQLHATRWNDEFDGISEFSSVDTAILIMGAMIAKNYFSSNARIGYLVDQLYNSVDFSKAIVGDGSSGQIFRELHENGEGIIGSESGAYNEYMIVAWLANHGRPGYDKSAGVRLWNNYYLTAGTNQRTATFGGHTALTDVANEFRSSFVHQFNYYYVKHFANSSYMSFFGASQAVDQAWFQTLTPTPPLHVWGNGAGAALPVEDPPDSGDFRPGYAPNAVDDNPDEIVSPHIIAGYIPLDGSTQTFRKDDLTQHIGDGRGLYSLPGQSNRKVLWRFSLKEPSWEPDAIEAIDFSTMLYGLASLPEYLGTNWFNSHNQVTLPVEPTDQAPFRASRFDNWVEAEDFDRGGEGVAYHDTSPGREGGLDGVYRRVGTDVDVGTGGVNGVNGFNVGWTAPGEWLEYTVENDFESGDPFGVMLHVAYASGMPEGGTARILMNGEAVDTDQGESFTLPSTGGWGNWSVMSTGARIDPDVNPVVIRFEVASGGFNLDKFQLVNIFEGGAGYFDQRIEAEDFDFMAGVQTETTQDVGGGRNVGWINDNDWMSYQVTIPETGTYRIDYRVSSENGGGVIKMDRDAGSILIDDNIPVPDTGGWQFWETVSRTVSLDAGTYYIGIFAKSGGWNLNRFDITKL